jgi:CRISPR-associated protein Cas1
MWLERARVHAEHGRVFYRSTQGSPAKVQAIPYANLAILFLGQGTSVSQEAARLLAQEAVYVAFTGPGGAPLHYGALSVYSGTSHFRRMLAAYMDADQSLQMAKRLMLARCDTMEKFGIPVCEQLFDMDARKLMSYIKKFRKVIGFSEDIPALLGYEETYAQGLYALLAHAAGFSRAGFSRQPGDGQSIRSGMSPSELTNSCIDHGNYLACGFAGATLWALGIPPQLSVFHGSNRSGGFVSELADCIKDSFVLPYAFAVGSGRLKGDPEKLLRANILENFQKKSMLSDLVRIVDNSLPVERAEPALVPEYAV